MEEKFSRKLICPKLIYKSVEEECTKYLTINTHRGLYNLKCLPFGLKVAPSVFQQIMDTMLAGLEFAMAYLDDILIKSLNLEEHKNHVQEVFKRIQNYGFKVGLNKCDFCMNNFFFICLLLYIYKKNFCPFRIEST